MKKSVIITLFLFTLLTLISGCTKTFTPENPKIAAQEAGFVVDPEYSFCSDDQTDCETFKYDGGSFIFRVSIDSSNQLQFRFAIKQSSTKTTVRLQYGLLQLMLKKIYPTDIVNEIMSAVKKNQSNEGTSENISWKVVHDWWDHEQFHDFKIFITPDNS